MVLIGLATFVLLAFYDYGFDVILLISLIF